jgi:hypothetical protein
MVCPRCGKSIQASAGKCPACGAGIAVAVLTPLPPASRFDQSRVVAVAGSASFQPDDAPTGGLPAELPPHFTTPANSIAAAAARAPVAAAQGGPLVLGQSFGHRYHIIRLLGAGGMGAVYQAWDAELGIAVAIKVIRPEVTADATTAADVERRFKRELVLPGHP